MLCSEKQKQQNMKEGIDVWIPNYVKHTPWTEHIWTNVIEVNNNLGNEMICASGIFTVISQPF